MRSGLISWIARVCRRHDSGFGGAKLPRLASSSSAEVGYEQCCLGETVLDLAMLPARWIAENNMRALLQVRKLQETGLLFVQVREAQQGHNGKPGRQIYTNITSLEESPSQAPQRIVLDRSGFELRRVLSGPHGTSFSTISSIAKCWRAKDFKAKLAYTIEPPVDGAKGMLYLSLATESPDKTLEFSCDIEEGLLHAARLMFVNGDPSKPVQIPPKTEFVFGPDGRCYAVKLPSNPGTVPPKINGEVLSPADPRCVCYALKLLGFDLSGSRLLVRETLQHIMVSAEKKIGRDVSELLHFSHL